MSVIPQPAAESPPPDAITLSPFYHSAVNEVTKPNSLVFCSHYFVDRWVRELGPLGAMIVVVLRSYCYHDRKTGELRDMVQRSMAQIAEEIGVSGKTIGREIEGNKALQKFIRVRPEYVTGRADGGLRRDSHSYMVAMDDPVHPQDEERLTALVREKARLMDKGGEAEAKERARQRARPLGQNVLAENSPDKMSQPSRQNVRGGGDKMSVPLGQNVLTLNESSESQRNSLNPPQALGDSLSLFSEKDSDQAEPSAQEIAAIRAAIAVPPEPPTRLTYKDIQAEWDAMPPDERDVYRPEALGQLHSAGHPSPSEKQVEPTMFKLFWAHRKGL